MPDGAGGGGEDVRGVVDVLLGAPSAGRQSQRGEASVAVESHRVQHR
jgi:hypothetical protein